ncbi:MAG TPA: hypothetical protein VGB82_26605 [Alphaproteobacteria bacterium]
MDKIRLSLAAMLVMTSLPAFAQPADRPQEDYKIPETPPPSQQRQMMQVPPQAQPGYSTTQPGTRALPPSAGASPQNPNRDPVTKDPMNPNMNPDNVTPGR